jgi:hypothetical protein
MMFRMTGLLLAAATATPWSGCLSRFAPNAEPQGIVQITLANDSATQYVAPNLGVCPQGMATLPHYFVPAAPVLAPGAEVTYTTDQIAGSDGNCRAFSTEFTVGLCGWSYGASATTMTAADSRLRGIIGAQFNCGDTVILHWSDSGDAGGTWTSEVQPAIGNPTPTEAFGPP